MVIYKEGKEQKIKTKTVNKNLKEKKQRISETESRENALVRRFSMAVELRTICEAILQACEDHDMRER